MLRIWVQTPPGLHASRALGARRCRQGGSKVAIREARPCRGEAFEPTALATAQGPQGPCFSPP